MTNLRLTQRDYWRIGVAVFGVLASGLILKLVWSSAAVWILLGLSLALILIVQMETFRRIWWEIRDVKANVRTHHEQSEALAGILSVLKPVVPLPRFGDWVVSPEVGRLLVSKVFERKPRIIVECGSGISTVLLAYALKQLGQGRVLSIEDNAQCAQETKRLLHTHKLTEWAQVTHAPIVPVVLNGGSWMWYDLRVIEMEDTVDLLFIDGPPGKLQSKSRYPAGPLLFQRLSGNAIVILDDGQRTDERAIVAMWLNEFPGLRESNLETNSIRSRAIILEREPEVKSRVA